MSKPVTDQEFLKVIKHRKGAIVLDFDKSDFRSIFALLTANSQENFFETYWEKRPVHFDNFGNTDNLVNENVFSREKLLRILGVHALPVETTLSALQYKDNLRKSWVFESDIADAREVSDAFSHSQTVQFFQPQRFSDELVIISAGFEHVFGSLAGASAYLTPANSQGLAPHHDDVDVFVLQCEGSKAWNLWENSLSLPENHSSDIARSSLPVKSTHVLLQPGDMLYLPRGTIHEALAQSSFSTHITISVYQQYNMKKLLLYLTPKLLDSAFAKNYRLRKGLPLHLSNKLGSYVGLQESYDESHVKNIVNKGDAVQPSIQSLHDRNERNQWRKALVDDVKQLMQSLSDEVCLQLLDETADDISSDFVMHRLPPPDLPSIDDEIVEEYSYRAHRNILAQTIVRVCDPTSMFCKVIEENGAIMLALAHNKNNSRAVHMGHPDHRDLKTSENNDEDDDEDGEGEDEDEEDGGNDYDAPEGIQWTLYLPIRMSPILFDLQKLSHDPLGTKRGSFCATGVTVGTLQDAVKVDRIFPDEVISTLKELYEAGFVYWQDTVNRGEQEKSKKREKDEKREKEEKREKNKGESGLKYQGQKTKAISFPSNDKTNLKSKIFFSPEIEKKRKLKSLQDVSMTAQHFHEGSKESSQIGYIVGSENIFYKTEKKKSKRKKLRHN